MPPAHAVLELNYLPRGSSLWPRLLCARVCFVANVQSVDGLLFLKANVLR